MNWIKEVVTPKIKAIIDTARNSDDKVLWTKCPNCDHMLYKEDLSANYMVCNYCGFHFQMSVDARMQLFFGKTYEKIVTISIKDDPLHFKDSKKYTDRLKEARKKTQTNDACAIGFGNIGEKSAVVFVMNFNFMGGSMGLAVGKSFAKAAQLAIEKNAALIACPASGGARMQEGMYSLMQMATTSSAVSEIKKHKLPFINVLTNPTTGGVLASFAMLGDINIAEPKALLGFAGARVIEKTMKQKLPDGFQKAEFLQEHGMIDIIVSRKEMNQKLAVILKHLMF